MTGNTSGSAFQNPSAPSTTAGTGARMPRRLQSRSRSAHDSLDSWNPSAKAISSVRPSARTPSITGVATSPLKVLRSKPELSHEIRRDHLRDLAHLLYLRGSWSNGLHRDEPGYIPRPSWLPEPE